MSGSDDGFGTTSTLSVELDERSLTNVKHQIESEIGSMPLGVTDGGSMSAQMAGGAGSGRERRRRRREFRWARERTGYLEDAVTYLEEIDDKVGEGDDGGIAGGIINQVIDSGGDAGGAAALSGAAAALTGAATAHTGAAAAHGGAAAALTAAAGALSGAGGSSVSVEKPAWTPLQVEDVGPLDVEDVDPLAIEEPGTYPLEEPSGDYPLAEPSGTYPVEEPSKPYPVEDVGPIPVDVSVSVGQGSSSSGAGEREAPHQWANDILRDVPVVGPSLADANKEVVNSARDWGRDVPLLPEPVPNLKSSDNKRRQEQGQTSSVTVEASQPPDGSQSINYTDNSTTEVVVETNTEDVVDDAIDEIEREYDDRIADIESELDDLRREIKDAARGRR
ncbi:hypothetical protein [Haloarcula sebkhae]|uniref:Uncharacterized protein n=2 Tax=Haloarcula sebkhae TaxID=932660 RepID=A0ACC6VIS4_9EURY|nr:hypothetical protein [Haloarcula sebkhae]GGK74523.1 hypothetical protein GCM10009067_28390 [Haloarcula sebkhae]